MLAAAGRIWMRVNLLFCATPWMPRTEAIVTYTRRLDTESGTAGNQTHNVALFLLNHAREERFQNPEMCERIHAKGPAPKLFTALLNSRLEMLTVGYPQARGQGSASLVQRQRC
jgi:hypothetical protein